MDDVVRIGQVSSVDPATGMVSVTYPDRGGSTAIKLPVLYSGIARWPEIGELAVVLHQGNGSAHGVVLGGLLNSARTVPDYQQGVAVLDLQGAGIVVSADGRITFRDASGSITLQEILELKERVRRLEEEA